MVVISCLSTLSTRQSPLEQCSQRAGTNQWDFYILFFGVHQPLWESLFQGTGEENSADSRNPDSGETMWILSLAGETTDSSIPSTGCSRVRGSLLNQSTCVLRTWRKNAVSLVAFCGRCSGSKGLEALYQGLYGPYTTRVGAWFSLPAVSQTCYQCMLGCPLSPVLFIILMHLRARGVLVWEPLDLISAFRRWCGLVGSFQPGPPACPGVVCSWVWSGWDENQHLKSEAMVLNRKNVACSLWVGGELLPQGEEFKYLGVLFTSEGRIECGIDR